MTQEFRYRGGELGRLRVAREELSAGCCGVVWGVYDMEPPLYEATFVDEHGGQQDVTFESDDVDEIVDISAAPHPGRLQEILKVFGSTPRMVSASKPDLP
jgi:hypothetical protein